MPMAGGDDHKLARPQSELLPQLSVVASLPQGPIGFISEAHLGCPLQYHPLGRLRWRHPNHLPAPEDYQHPIGLVTVGRASRGSL